MLHSAFSKIVLFILLSSISFDALYAQSKDIIIEEFSPDTIETIPFIPPLIICTEYIYLEPKTKNISGIVTGLNADGMITPLRVASVSYVDNYLMAGESPFGLYNNHDLTDYDGQFIVPYADTICEYRYLVIEKAGYEPLFVNLDTLATDYLSLQMTPRIYHIDIKYNKDTFIVDYPNLRKYSVPNAYIHGEYRSSDCYEYSGIKEVEHIYEYMNEYLPVKVSINSIGEYYYRPYSMVRWEDYLKKDTKIKRPATIELDIKDSKVTAVSVKKGRITKKDLDYMYKVPWREYLFLLSGWHPVKHSYKVIVNISKYRPERKK